MNTKILARQGARAIYGAFNAFHAFYKEITRRAQSRFESQDWHGAHQDALQRLELYKIIVDRIVKDIHLLLKQETYDRRIWSCMKQHYSEMIAGRNDIEIAETFFNSITRRIFSTVGVDPRIEFVDSDFAFPPDYHQFNESRVYPSRPALEELIKQLLMDLELNVEFPDLPVYLRIISEEIRQHLQEKWKDTQFDHLEVLESLFYRNKAAYVIGRFVRGDQILPLVLPLIHNNRGVVVDAVLMAPSEASIVFSFTRSYFQVTTERPRNLVNFLKSLMPHKPLSELYTSIGYHKHGKTELYRSLLNHLRNSDDQFEIAQGEKGMVMVVFTLPSYPVVFKIIKDEFAHPKSTTREKVKEKYRLVFKHDRAGRLVDAQEFEHLKFDKNRFKPELLKELLNVAGRTVQVEKDSVVIHHLYTERRLRPLSLHVNEVEEAKAREVVIDFGNCIKDLARVNIFPGDVLLKNFGVTRHGRVVFYDYDELALLTDCNFRKLPPPRDLDDELSPSPWFHVGENDIFPEEFRTFLGLQGTLRDLFLEHHQDLFDVNFWKGMQEHHRAGEILDIFPYPQKKRLHLKLRHKPEAI